MSNKQPVKTTGLAEYVGTAEAARRLGYSRYHIGRLIRQGAIPATKIFSFWRIKVSDLNALVKRGEGG